MAVPPLDFSFDFSNAAAKAPPAPQDTFDYPAAAAEIYADFPHLKNKLFFYDLGQRCWVVPDLETHQNFQSFTAENPQALEGLEKFVDFYRAEKNSCAMYAPNNTRLVFLYTNPDKHRMLGPNVPLKQELQFVLDHEMGHVAAKNGGRSLESLTRHENVADTYAAMRHFQRFGMKSPALAHQILWRAQRVVSLIGMRHAEHFTGFVLEKLLAVKESLNIEKLSPLETAALAGDFATAHTPDDKRVRNLSAVFNIFKERLAQNTPADDGAFRTLATTVLATSNLDARYWGKKVMDGYMDGTLGAARNGKVILNNPPAILEGDYWQNIHKALQAQIQTLEMPAAPPIKKTACPTKRLLMQRLQA